MNVYNFVTYVYDYTCVMTIHVYKLYDVYTYTHAHACIHTYIRIEFLASHSSTMTVGEYIFSGGNFQAHVHVVDIR